MKKASTVNESGLAGDSGPSCLSVVASASSAARRDSCPPCHRWNRLPPAFLWLVTTYHRPFGLRTTDPRVHEFMLFPHRPGVSTVTLRSGCCTVRGPGPSSALDKAPRTVPGSTTNKNLVSDSLIEKTATSRMRLYEMALATPGTRRMRRWLSIQGVGMNRSTILAVVVTPVLSAALFGGGVVLATHDLEAGGD